MSSGWFEVGGYRLSAERHYDPERHFWVELEGGSARVRIGFDPLGRETRGDVVELSLSEPGSQVGRGKPFGTLEAAKFVGPLESPVSGTVVGVNQAVLGNPRLLNEDTDANWMIEIELADHSALDMLLQGEEHVRPWFAAEIEKYRRQGAVAE